MLYLTAKQIYTMDIIRCIDIIEPLKTTQEYGAHI